MDDWLIDDDRLSIERKSILPGEGFFHPDTVEEAEREREATETLADAGTVVIADPDADGLACVALIREAAGEAALLEASPHNLARAFEWTAEYLEPGADVFVCDLCPDDTEDIAGLADITARAGSVRWFDHHQWDDDLAAAVEDAGVDLTVGESEEACTADVALAELDADFDDRFVDLTAVTRDHDLWIRDDPRSDDLADLAHWTEPAEYIDIVREHGADLPAEAEELLAERRIEKEALVEKAVERAQLREVGPWTVGVTYGRCSQNEVAEALREQGADAAVIVKPAGSASIRGTDTFERAHEVAAQVNGGGHPKAAGCKPDVYDDMLDYAHHWTTRGAVAKQAIVDAFRRLDVEE
ncbi:Oligoribonuclease NrnB or cAMP/cGMP phosphodiesterase, DHH superfamily [Halorhabdus sp. SVX81]|uniref:DHH family phosphoesterase n=1 Tax=Halorhabdus sp. SVX81 TaxID=2978283 RepID=UPI0023DC6BBB|nr:recombinase RecJ [Halorhabdus sp. SVX81]WEL16837.1 Oligoribonuclease NrnB or cAMP/cGMP phosphodiesterase, DHH superfamily [Halorhabdus sp. SVX81]